MIEWYSGFKTDCSTLIQSFASKKSPKFSHFCVQWKSNSFQYVFYGHASGIELVQHIQECFQILKQLFIQSTDCLELIGLLYLFYAMYFKQPPKKYCKMNVTQEEWTKFKNFYNRIDTDNQFNEVKLIFWKLLTEDAFHFVRSVKDYGLDCENQETIEDEDDTSFPFQTKYFHKLVNSEVDVLNDKKTGILTALDILECGYNEMKDMLDTTPRAESDLSKILPPSNIVNELKMGLENISKIYENESVEIVNPGDKAWATKTTKNKKTRRQLKRKAMMGIVKNENETVVKETVTKPIKVYTRKKKVLPIMLEDNPEELLDEFINSTAEHISVEPCKDLEIIN